MPLINQFIKVLHREFEMKDLGYLYYFLGIQVKRNKHGLLLSQENYAMKILQRADMAGCKPIQTLCLPKKLL